MLKITFGKTRYNADRLHLNEENNTLELGNGYMMTNLAENIKLSDFLNYINKQYELGDNIINAEIWYSRNGGSETEPNFIVEKMMQDEATNEESKFKRNIFVDSASNYHYGYKIIDIQDDTILMITPRSIILLKLSTAVAAIDENELDAYLTQFDIIHLATIENYFNEKTPASPLTITSKTFKRVL